LTSWILPCAVQTILYVTDTIYACQDREEDKIAGAKSAPVTLGDYVLYATAFAAFMFVTLITYVGCLNKQTPIFYTISVGGTAAHLIWQYATVDIASAKSCNSE
jgi:4-hydroxybenzoate polyprenyltransferase